jgi:hypothetical protein
MGVMLGLVAVLLVARPALANVFVVGPGMLGNPGADDPGVGYSSLDLDLEFVYPESALPFAFVPAGDIIRQAGEGPAPEAPTVGGLERGQEEKPGS